MPRQAKPLPPVELAVLGLLLEGPAHGYELWSRVEAKGVHAWADVGFSSVYNVMAKLRAKGFVDYRLRESDRGLPVKIYAVTPDGREVFGAAIRDILSDPPVARSMFDIALAHIRYLETDELIEALGRYRERLEKELHEADAAMTRSAEHRAEAGMTLILGRTWTHLRAELTFVEGLLRSVGIQPPTSGLAPQTE